MFFVVAMSLGYVDEVLGRAHLGHGERLSRMYPGYRGTSLIRKGLLSEPIVCLCLGPYGGPRGKYSF